MHENLATRTEGLALRNRQSCNHDEYDTLGQMRQRQGLRDKARERLTHRPVQETRERRDRFSHISVLSISHLSFYPSD